MVTRHSSYNNHVRDGVSVERLVKGAVGGGPPVCVSQQPLAVLAGKRLPHVPAGLDKDNLGTTSASASATASSRTSMGCMDMPAYVPCREGWVLLLQFQLR